MTCRSRGFSLIELVIAMVLTALATTVLAAATVYAQRNLNRAFQTEAAARAAATVIDSLLREPEPRTGARVMDGVDVRWVVSGETLLNIRTVVRAGQPPGDTLAFDAWVPRRAP